ncbi:MAG: hypothetical protein WBN36_17425 [Gammaproteobacteria bacterium]|jgi:hypothetical protein
MLTLKDLSADKELDRKAMTEVQGGSNFAYIGEQIVHDGDGIAIGSPNTVIKADAIVQNDNDLGLNVLSPFGQNWTF